LGGGGVSAAAHVSVEWRRLGGVRAVIMARPILGRQAAGDGRRKGGVKRLAVSCGRGNVAPHFNVGACREEWCPTF
jgi:hypothetical protein